MVARAPFLEHIRASEVFGSDGRVVIPVFRSRPGFPVTLIRMVVAVPIPDTGAGGNVLEDSFDRIVAPDSWGTPDVGPDWVIDGATGTVDYEVNANRGMIDSSAAAVRRMHVNCPVDGTDLNFLGRIQGATHGAGVDFSGASIRTQGDGNGYWFMYDGTDLSLRRGDYLNSNGTVLATVAKVLGTAYTFRLTAIGSVIAVSTWTAVEPVTPDLSAVDLTYTQGGVGAYTQQNGGGGADYDDFIVSASASSITSPLWDAFLNDPNELSDLIDSSVTNLDRWIPSIVNGQRVEAGEQLYIVGSGGTPGTVAVVSCYALHDLK